jgi:hypothetical protein
MKKTILAFLLIFLFTTSCYGAGALAGIVSGGGAAAGVWSCTDANILCENFDGATDCGNDAANAQNCANTWVVDETKGNALFATADTVCAGKGTYVLHMEEITDNSNAGVSATFDAGATKSISYFQGYFKMVNDIYADTAAISPFTAYQSTAGTLSYQVRFERVSAGVYKIGLQYNNRTGWVIVYSATTNLALNTWYGVRVYFESNKASGTGISWAIDYNLSGTFIDQSIASPLTQDYPPRYWMTSSNYSDSLWLTQHVSVDMIKINSSAYPAASCP